MTPSCAQLWAGLVGDLGPLGRLLVVEHRMGVCGSSQASQATSPVEWPAGGRTRLSWLGTRRVAGVTSATVLGYGRAAAWSSRRSFLSRGVTYLSFGAIGTRSARGFDVGLEPGDGLPLATVPVVQGPGVLDPARTGM